MAGKNVDEVYVGVDGIVATGVVGVAPAPTSASSSLTAEWADLGYVSEEGVTETTEQTSTPLKAWQNGKKVRTIVEDGVVKYALALLQTSAETVAFYYGGTVATDGSIVVNPNAQRPKFAFNLDVIDGSNRIRAYGPESQVVEVGDQVYQNGEPVGYEVTIECAYNEALGGSVKKWYSALAAVAAPIVSAATPPGAAAGAMVKITGLNFTGATSVKFGATEAAAKTVDAADTIYATLPAGAAGSAAVTVVTPAGTSNALAYTRA